MSSPTTFNLQNPLTLPKKILDKYKTSKFTLTPLEGVLILEPEDNTAPTYTLTSDEEQKLANAVNEASQPIEHLKRN